MVLAESFYNNNAVM